MIFGKKEIFAIEIYSKKTDFKIGLFFIWVNNNRIGKEENTYIKPNLIAIERIRDLSSYSFLDINQNEVTQIFSTILSDDLLYSQTLLGFGETFDNVLLRPYVFEGFVVFLWSYVQNGLKLGKKSKQDVKFGKIKYQDFQSVVNECKVFLNNL